VTVYSMFDVFRVLIDDDGERDWMTEAACKGCDPDLFFSEKAGAGQRFDGAAAEAVCHTCPVEARCLDYAIANHEHTGVWGGMSGRRRRAEASRRLRAAQREQKAIA
jgi:WhiB family redox-sensing transcriptional regulator